MSKRYVWWIENNKGGWGQWNTEKKAQKAIDLAVQYGFLREDFRSVKYEAEQCSCGRYTRKDLLESLGECLCCDHVHGDVTCE